jgi:hypothetical protein
MPWKSIRRRFGRRQRYPKDQQLLVTGEVASGLFVLRTGRLGARRYDLLGHLAPIVEQVISSLKWDSSQARRPWRCCTGQPGRGLASGGRSLIPTGNEESIRVNGCVRVSSRHFAEKIPSVMRKGFGRHIEPDRLEPKALHP